MNQFNELLTSVSKQYKIARGRTESESDWKIRLVYSICGMMAYASLWDDVEDGQISIDHFKKRIRKISESYKEMYPEISGDLPCSGKLEKTFFKIFKNAGVIYHRPYYIAPSIRHDATTGNVCLQRGISPDDIDCVSGVGFYSIPDISDNIGNARLMFGLEERDLLSIWENACSTASWMEFKGYGSKTEYLNMKPPFTKGYWANLPDASGRVSILRTGNKGKKQYYLYRCNNGCIEASKLLDWTVQKGNYLVLANACLSAYNKRPPIKYFRDGDIVNINVEYLLPPREHGFLMLYSWPKKCASIPCNFERKCSSNVFGAIQSILTEEGYSFEEVKYNA